MNTDNPSMTNELNVGSQTKSGNTSKWVAQDKMSPSRWFFFLRSMVLAIFPAENSYSRKEKNIVYLQKFAYLVFFTMALRYGGVFFIEKMQPFFNHLTQAHYPQYMCTAIMIGLVLSCIGAPAWLACWLAFSVQPKIEKKLMTIMYKEGFTSFKPKLRQYALFIGPGMFEQLFYETLTTKNLHCYQVLLEFNASYHLYDMQTLTSKEHERQQQQVFTFLKGNSNLSRSYHKELKFLIRHTVGQYYHQANRVAYDCLILCLLEKSFWKKTEGGAHVCEFSEWFHYFMNTHDLSHNQVVSVMFSECDRLRSYLPLLAKYQFKNSIEEQLAIYNNDNVDDENEVQDSMPVLKI
jgi:hypothetical protein